MSDFFNGVLNSVTFDSIKKLLEFIVTLWLVGNIIKEILEKFPK